MPKSNIFRILWCCISVLIGLVAYNTLEYSKPTLIMEVKTVAQGSKKLAITDHDGKKHTVTFNLNGKWGINSSEPGKRMYVIELPATDIETINIQPLASPGAFEISRITISDDIISYMWDENSVCSKKTLYPQVEKYRSCSVDSPNIKASADGSVEIMLIKDIGRKNSLAMRLSIAIILSVGCMLCLWLLRKAFFHCGSGVERWNRLGIVSVWLLLAAAYSYQLFLVCKYATNVPYFDEWDYFDLSGKLCIPDKLSIAWLFDFWSEHIIVPTKLMIWLNLKFFSLNLQYDKICNYLVYGLLLLTIIGLKERLTGKGAFAYFPAFIIFLISPIAHENHLWGFQSQTHFFLLLSIVPLYFAFRQQPTYKTTVLFCIPLLVNIFTFGAGVVIAVVYMASYGLHIVANIFKKQIKPVTGHIIVIACTLPMIPCIYLRFHGYQKAGWTPIQTSPLTVDFWAYFSNILSLGFGFIDVNVIPGIICSIIILIPMVLLVMNSKTRWETSTWSVVTAILGIFAVLAAISYGRGGFNEPKTSRYSEYGLMLIPLASLAWWLVLKNTRSRFIVLSALWIALFISFNDTWSVQPYREKKQIDVFHLECIESYFEGTGDGVCQGGKRGLDRAAQVGASFTRPFIKSIQQLPDKEK